MTSKDIFVPNAEHLKCAPSKKYENGSCFTIESLIKIANAYNNYVGSSSNKKKINITNSKEDLIEQLTNRITTCGSDQLCWLDVEWIKNMNDYEINKNTFRPKGPQGRFKWLSTTNIDEIVEQYEFKYKDFKFLGAVPYDFDDLPQLGIRNLDFDNLIKTYSKIGIVFNLDEHWKSGSHWVALYADLQKNQIYYFDSYGIKPRKRIADFAKRIALWCYNRHILGIQKGGTDEINDTETNFMRASKNKYEKVLNVEYNKTRHQFKNSECGVYSVNFILRLLNGESFEHICNIPTNDDKVNECRKVYMRFK